MPIKSEPIFSHAEPVLAVTDVAATIRYWKDVLGFPVEWSWGDPPVLGAVSWHGAFVQFLRDPVLAQASVGNNVWIRLRRVEALFAMHRERGVEIVDGLRMHEYGLAQYSIRDCNGYYIHFAGPPPREMTRKNEDAGSGEVAEGRKAEVGEGLRGEAGEVLRGEVAKDRGGGAPGQVGEAAEERVRIEGRVPSAAEFQALVASLGWDALEPDLLAKRLGAAIYGVVAEEVTSDEIIGCALLTGDQASYYYVKDVLVRPEWQGRGVGTALMRGISGWLDEFGVKGAMVSLICREELEPFYQQSGFGPVFSMMRLL